MEKEKTMLGYQNKVLRIDLTKKGASFEPLRMDFARKYVGSKGLAIRYMYEELKPGIDPLGPENKLFLTTGPLTGTPVPCSGKLSVAAKSPATGTMNDCSIGGHVGIRLKFAGYDMVIFEGKLSEPGYILIDDDKIRFMDAKDLWGLGSHEAEKILAEIKKNPLLDGVTFSGGEPLCQAAALLPLAKEIKKLGLNLFIYTGSIFEDLLKEQNPDIMALLQQGDFLVDGPFVLAQRDLTLLFRGSQNQRILDLPQSFLQGKAVLASIGQ